MRGTGAVEPVPQSASGGDECQRIGVHVSQQQADWQLSQITVLDLLTAERKGPRASCRGSFAILAAMRGASSRDQLRWMVAGNLKRETDERAGYLMSQGPACPDFCSLVPGAPVVLGNSGRGPLGTRRAGPHSATGSISVASSAGFLPFPSDRVIA